MKNLVEYMGLLRAARFILKDKLPTEVSFSFLQKFTFTGFKEYGQTIVPTWRVNPDTYSRSKYATHQKTRECARRKNQCRIQDSASGLV
jgi:hypothetical protein